MRLWKRIWLPAVAVLFIVASTATAQNDDWFDDDPLVIVDEQLENLGDMLDFDFVPDLNWTESYCKDDDECDVHVIFDDGQHVVIVNGDTLKDRGRRWPHKQFSYRLGPGMHMRGHGRDLDFTMNPDNGFRWKFDSKLRDLERDARSIARKARKADEPEKAQLEKELDQKLNEIFDYKLEQQKERIADAEKRVRRLKERQSKRESSRDEIIENRKDELLGRDRYLEW